MVNCVPVLHTSENLIQKKMGSSRFAHLWNFFLLERLKSHWFEICRTFTISNFPVRAGWPWLCLDCIEELGMMIFGMFSTK